MIRSELCFRHSIKACPSPLAWKEFEPIQCAEFEQKVCAHRVLTAPDQMHGNAPAVHHLQAGIRTPPSEARNACMDSTNE